VNTSVEELSQPWYSRKPLTEKIKSKVMAGDDSQDSIAIIGGGIASAMLCYQLCRKGVRVSLYCKDEKLAQNASGNGQGAIYPLLNAKHDAASQFSLQAYLQTLVLLKELEQAGACVPFSPCGVTLLGFDPSSIAKNDQLSDSPLANAIFQILNAAQTNEQTGIDLSMPSIHYQDAGWVNAAELTQLLIDFALPTDNLCIHFNCEVSELHHIDDNWQLNIVNGGKPSHPAVVIASGHTIKDFEQSKDLPLSAVRGQVSHIPSVGVLPNLKTVLCYKGYLTPHNNFSGEPQQAIHHLGASHNKDDHSLVYSHYEQQQNKKNLEKCLVKAESLVESIDVSKEWARVSIRCASRDHLPFVGQVPKCSETIELYTTDDKGARSSKKIRDLPLENAPVYDGLYMLAGLGSRGLCTAALCSQILVAQMLDEKQMVSVDILDSLSPNRMWIRKLLRGRPVRHYED